MQKRALITGITGQDGSYLAEWLLSQGYEVVGMLRRSSTLNFERIAHIQDKLTSFPPMCSTRSRSSRCFASSGRRRSTTLLLSRSCRPLGASRSSPVR